MHETYAGVVLDVSDDSSEEDSDNKQYDIAPGERSQPCCMQLTRILVSC